MTTSLPPSVAIVLVNWNNWRDCAECIDSLLGMDYSNFHVFLIDNDSADQSIEKLQAWCNTPTVSVGCKQLPGVRFHTDLPTTISIGVRLADATLLPLPPPEPTQRISLIRSGGNLGFAGGCNVGIRSSLPDTYDYFWFLNTDTVVDRQALRYLVERAQQDVAIGMVGSTVLYHDRPDVVQAQAGAWLNPKTGESRHIGEGIAANIVTANAILVEQQLAYIFGASMLVSHLLIKRIGLMQEDYFLYYEEMDWAMRSRDQFKFAYASQSLIYHKSGNSSSKTMPIFAVNLFYRNRVRFISRFFPQFMSATKRGLMQTMLRYLIKGQWRKASIIGEILFRADQIAYDALQASRATTP
ncbi:MAG: glycosyltransferase family 2 protein [Steroidobacteraceae bacterium]